MNFELTKQQISHVIAALSIRSKIDDNVGYSNKNSAAQNWFACVAKHIANMTQYRTTSTLAAKPRKKERLKIVVMVPCPSTAKFWM